MPISTVIVRRHACALLKAENTGNEASHDVRGFVTYGPYHTKLKVLLQR